MTAKALGQNTWFLATNIVTTPAARRPFYPAMAIWAVLIGWAGRSAGFEPVAALTYWVAVVAVTAVAVLITLTIWGVVLGRYRQP